MGPRRLQRQESVLSEYIVGGRRKVTWCVEFKLWQDPKYLILWNANISMITTHRKSSRSNLGHIYSNLFLHTAGYCGDTQSVNLTSTSAPNLKHSKEKVHRIHQTHDDPRGPRKKKKTVFFWFCFFCYHNTKIDVLHLHWWFLVCPLPAMEWAPKKGSEQKTACWTTQHELYVVKVDIQFDSLRLGFTYVLVRFQIHQDTPSC